MIVDLQKNGIIFRLNGDNLKVKVPTQIIDEELIDKIRQNKAQLISELKQLYLELAYWRDLIRQTTKPEEVFNILNDFRLLSWSDEQRAEVSRCYIRQLDVINLKNDRGGDVE